jgi:ketosteroid isomerase-like protein
MSQENVDAFWRDMDAFRRGDFDAWVDGFHDDAEFVPRRAPIQGTYRGHNGLREFLADNAETSSCSAQPTSMCVILATACWR